MVPPKIISWVGNGIALDLTPSFDAFGLFKTYQHQSPSPQPYPAINWGGRFTPGIVDNIARRVERRKGNKKTRRSGVGCGLF